MFAGNFVKQEDVEKEIVLFGIYLSPFQYIPFAFSHIVFNFQKMRNDHLNFQFCFIFA